MSREAAITAEVRALERLDLEGLRGEWRRRWGAPPKLRSPELLRYVIAWRIQVAAFGDVDPHSRRELRRPTASARRRAPIPSGTRLSREWRGVRHDVEATPDGFRYEGRVFRSLSAIASTIAGSKWNGRRFFGLDDQ